MAKVKVIKVGKGKHQETVLARHDFKYETRPGHMLYELRLTVSYHRIVDKRRSYGVYYEVKRGGSWRYVGSAFPDINSKDKHNREAAKTVFDSLRASAMMLGQTDGDRYRKEAVPAFVEEYLSNADRIKDFHETKSYEVGGSYTATFSVVVNAHSAKEAGQIVKDDPSIVIDDLDGPESVEIENVERHD